MERIYAYTDESGAFGWDLDNPNVSTHFIISAVIVKEHDIDILNNSLELVRKKHFQTGEMKSSLIGKNQERRKRIIADVLSLPFSIFTIVIDKQKLTNYYGLQRKTSFYKFLNNIVHKELKRAYRYLTIVADEIGGSDYMQSFAQYVKKRQDIPSLFGEADFYFENSKNSLIIQLADLISGTIAREYDNHKKDDNNYSFIKMLDSKITRTQVYPQTYENYTVNNALTNDYDKQIAEICFKQAALFIKKYEDSEDEIRSAQIITLNYLLFRFMNNDLRKYISTHEIMHQLDYIGVNNFSVQQFRTSIIANLRDNGVIIASSNKGYKIPSKEAELYDFINHGTSIIVPMLERLKKCRDLVKLATVNELDLFDHTEYRSLKKYFDE